MLEASDALLLPIMVAQRAIPSIEANTTIAELQKAQAKEGRN